MKTVVEYRAFLYDSMTTPRTGGVHKVGCQSKPQMSQLQSAVTSHHSAERDKVK